MMILYIVIAVAVIGAGIFFFMKNKKKSSNQNVANPKSDGYLGALPLKGWDISFSPGMPSKMDGSFNFPVEKDPDRCSAKKHLCNSVHYVWKWVSGKIRDGGSLTMDFEITAPNVTSWNYKLEPTNTGNSPAKVAFIFQRKGSNMTEEWGRMFCKKRAVLKHGKQRLSVKIDRNDFIGVYGKTPPVKEWNKMLENVGRVGMTFGGGSFFGHGVNVTGGTAKFKLTNFRFK